MEASSAAFETAAILEGKLKEAKAKIEAWKSTLEADKAELKRIQNELDRQIEALRGAHAVVKGLKKEKFDLMRRNNLLVRGIETYQAEVEKL